MILLVGDFGELGIITATPKGLWNVFKQIFEPAKVPRIWHLALLMDNVSQLYVHTIKLSIPLDHPHSALYFLLSR